MPTAPPRRSVYLDGVPVQQLIVAEGWARIKGPSLQDEDMVAAQHQAEQVNTNLVFWSNLSLLRGNFTLPAQLV